MILPGGKTAVIFGELRFMVTTRRDENNTVVYAVWDEQNQGYVCLNGFITFEFSARTCGYESLERANRFASYLNDKIDWTK